MVIGAFKVDFGHGSRAWHAWLVADHAAELAEKQQAWHLHEAYLQSLQPLTTGFMRCRPA